MAIAQAAGRALNRAMLYYIEGDFGQRRETHWLSDEAAALACARNLLQAGATVCIIPSAESNDDDGEHVPLKKPA